MCGRYYIDNEEDITELREIMDALNRKYYGGEKLSSMKTGEIFPTDMAPVLASDGAELMTWGFPIQGTSRTVINARSETAFEKPMFAKALSSQRAVIPTTGFYEWSHIGKKAKDKFLFRLPGMEMLYLAGIYTEFNLPTGKETRFTILTTEANNSMNPYHARMPVYVGHSEIKSWICDAESVSNIMNRVQPELTATLVDRPMEQMSMF